ncbi:MAG: GTPase [Burkholderiaceae bacterium]|nr:GTPase [Burkholderiaceae bacterium]MDH5209790.1 GTPase [Burkholderiaceae bacterium]
MNTADQNALLTIALLGAFADGSKGEAERAEVRRVAESLGDAQVNMAALYQDVLLKRATVASAAAALSSPELKQLAFELAVGVCDADGLRNEAETRFLAELGQALGLTQPQIAEPAATADALATMPLEDILGKPAETSAAPAAAAAAAAASTGPVVTSVADRSDAELDKMILNYSILNGALELLPQSMASMAIIPLQMKMVYRIGKSHGYELDRGHIKDLLATMGVGLTGQYLEEIGRKVIGGLLGKVAGRMAGGLARGATGAAFSFATTYALGQVAKRYYAGGRTMSTQMLKDAYASMLTQARGLQGQYAPQIEQQARTVDVSRIVQMVRAS